jgi:hypothetical protein
VTPQKFNTFNTFNTFTIFAKFAKFAKFANFDPALEHPTLIHRQVPRPIQLRPHLPHAAPSPVFDGPGAGCPLGVAWWRWGEVFSARSALGGKPQSPGLSSAG